MVPSVPPDPGDELPEGWNAQQTAKQPYESAIGEVRQTLISGIDVLDDGIPKA